MKPSLGKNRPADDILSPDQNGTGVKPAAEKEKTPAQLETERLLNEANDFVTKKRHIWNMMAGDSTLQYEVDEKGYRFDHMKGKVYLDLKWWRWAEKYHLTESQKTWAVLHEIGHFEDLRQDPEGYRNGFTEYRRKADSLADKVLDIWKNKPGYQPATHHRQMASDFVFGELKTFYNVLDDIFVNDGVAMNNLRYRPGGGDYQETVNLYRDYLFPIGERGVPTDDDEVFDLSDRRLTEQFMMTPLRQRMVPNQPVKVSPEIDQLLNSTKIPGIGDTLMKKMYRIYRKTPSYDRVQNTATLRKNLTISLGLEKTFVDLLMQDIENLPPPPPPEDNKKKGQPDKKSDGQGENKPEKQDSGDSGKPQPDKPEDQKSEQKPGEKGEEKPDKKPNGKDKPEEKPDNNGQPQNGDRSPDMKPGQGRPNPWAKDWPEFPDVEFTPEMVDDFIAGKEAKEKDDAAKAKAKAKLREATPEEIGDMDEGKIDPLLKEIENDPTKFSNAQKDKARQRGKDLKLCRENKIDPKTASEYRRLQTEIQPYKDEMAELFEKMMININESLVLTWERGFRRGKINLPDLIRKYGQFFADDKTISFLPFDELDAFDQKEYISRLTIRPEIIRARLLLDCSQSMNVAKREQVKKITILLMESFETAENKINRRYKMKKPVQIDTEVIAYGTQAKLIKEFAGDKGRNYGTDRALVDKLKTIEALNVDMNYTNTYLGWKIIEDEIKKDPEYAAKIRQGKIRDLAIDITDGGASQAGYIRRQVDGLEKKGMITRGIQIEPADYDRQIFKMIWNKDRKDKRGSEVKELGELVKFFLETLKNELRKIDLVIEEYEED